MKKNIIYTLCLLLSGAFLFSSCEDMLENDTTRVDNSFGSITMNDSVYSVLGILKSMQNLGDRQVILGELRADLVSVVEDKANVDLQDISKFIYNDDNQYLSIKDYYSVINNCNVYLARVDTNLVSKNEKVMLREFVAVTSMRAWTYLQLAINYGNVRYFTRPLLTHGDVQEEMSKAPISRHELLSHLIEELAPYENPRVYPMPAWTGVKTAAGVTISTEKLFVPIRMLLGELHLWRGMPGDYTAAANYYYKMLTDSPSFPLTSGFTYYFDSNEYAEFMYNASKGTVMTDYVLDSYSDLFEDNGGVVSKGGSALAVIPYQNTTTTGSISNLSDVFFPEVAGMAQAVASQGYTSLSDRQTYYAYDPTGTGEAKYNPAGANSNFPGDLRRFTVTGATRNSELKQVFSNNILKHCMPSSRMQTTDNIYLYTPGKRTGYVQLYRDTHIFMRFAEALLGMERFEGYTFLTNSDLKGATPIDGKYRFASPAMDILKRGMDWNYTALQNISVRQATEEEKLAGDYFRVENPAGGEDSLQITNLGNVLEFDMISIDAVNIENIYDGIHARGSGNSEFNQYYALNDTCIARYNGELEELGEGVVQFPAYTKEDSLAYVADLLLDELALEFCFEGQRFGDLIRFAKAAEMAGDPNWKDILVKRVNARNISNTVSYRALDYQVGDGGGISVDLNDESNWYMPFPNDELVETLPGEDDEENTPGEEGGAENTPGEEGGAENTPGEEGGAENTPGEENGAENTPGEEGGAENTPGEEGGEENITE